MGADFTGFQDIIPQVLDEQTVLSLTAHVPTSLLRSSLLAGTADEVVDQVAEWRDFGVDYGVFANASFSQPSMKNALAASGPFLQILRKVRKL
jgi:phthiodiolone/phenolphthiodiolone dimycocerosates ketoreductase